MDISFCLPKEYWPNQSWIEAFERGEVIPLEKQGKGAVSQCWIYQTWRLLIEAGVSCFLREGLPKDGGIIIAMSPSFYSIAALLKSEATQTTRADSWLRPFFLVDIVADGLPHPAAHLHLVQNREHARRLPRSLFMPHWPQPHLIPRDQARGLRFEKICFFGDVRNLAPELCSIAWQEKLYQELGLVLEIRGADQWHDYSDVDGVIAIRDFGYSRHLHKPATKLYNAWLAGVPFIAGNDSAYAADGHPGRDYLVATSAEKVFQHLKRLKNNPLVRQNLVKNGSASSAAYTREATFQRWKRLLQTTLPQEAHAWHQQSALKRSWFYLSQRLVCFADRVLR